MMLTRLIWPILAVALVGGPVFAQTMQQGTESTNGKTSSAAGDAAVARSPAGEVLLQQEAGQVLSDAIIGKDVTDIEGKTIGAVSGLILEPDGRVAGLLVKTGGLLGIGAKEVALPVEDFGKFVGSDQIALRFTQQEIGEFPEYRTRADIRREQEMIQQKQKQQRQEQDLLQRSPDSNKTIE